MRLKSDLKRIDEDLKVSSHSGVQGSTAEVFELSLDELSYVAGGSIEIFLKIPGVD